MDGLENKIMFVQGGPYVKIWKKKSSIPYDVPLFCTHGRTGLLTSIWIYEKEWPRDSNPVPEGWTAAVLSIELLKLSLISFTESAGTAFLLKFESACERFLCELCQSCWSLYSNVWTHLSVGRIFIITFTI